MHVYLFFALYGDMSFVLIKKKNIFILGAINLISRITHMWEEMKKKHKKIKKSPSGVWYNLIKSQTDEIAQLVLSRQISRIHSWWNNAHRFMHKIIKSVHLMLLIKKDRNKLLLALLYEYVHEGRLAWCESVKNSTHGMLIITMNVWERIKHQDCNENGICTFFPIFYDSCEINFIIKIAIST